MNNIIQTIQHTARAATVLLLALLAAQTAWADTGNVADGVYYVDADGNVKNTATDGIEGNDTPIVLNGGGDTTLSADNWYVVNHDITYTGTITLSDHDVTIILCDGKTMNIGTASEPILNKNCINGAGDDRSLTIYGQSGQTGVMKAYGSAEDCSSVYVKNFTQYGGNVIVNSANGKTFVLDGGNLTLSRGTLAITASGTGYTALKFDQNNNATIAGGTLTVISEQGYAIEGTVIFNGGNFTANGYYAGILGDVYLGWSNLSDSFTCNSYNGVYDVIIAEGKTFYDDMGNSYTASTPNLKESISGKTLHPWGPGDWAETANNEYTIGSPFGWEVFCDALQDNDTWNRFSGKTVKLGDDISVTRMADGQPFTGTFDGDGHTLTLNYGTADAPVDAQFVAPFVATSADGEHQPVFRNLTIDGTIYDSYSGSEAHNVGGLIGHLYGDVTIEHCTSNLAITSVGGAGGFVGLCEHTAMFTDCKSSVVITSPGGNNSGFVSWSRASGHTISFDGCVFNGKLLQQNGEGGSNGCFIGWKGDAKIVNITNCLCAPATLADGEMMATDGSATFSREHSNYPATITNSYYTAAFDIAQGKQAHTVTAGTDVTVAHAGVATHYATSGITAYKATGASTDSDLFIAGLLYNNNVLYAGSGDQVSLTLSHGDREGYTFDGGYAASAGTLSGTDNPYTLTMPDENVTISAAWLRLPYVTVNVTGSGTVTCGEQNATDGNPFDVTTEKGASVALTLAPTDGNAVRSVAYGYTNNSGMTASGFKLPISGTTATLTVPDGLKDGTGVTVTVTFVPALNGGADEASAVALTDNTVTDLGGGWYKVENDISFDHTLNLLADTYLTIAEGKTMTVNTASGQAIDSEYTLNVSGEGTLSVATTGDYGIAVCVGNYVQTGATVTASGYIGIRCTDAFIGFDFDNDFTFSGGQLTATGPGYGDGIWADNDITLSCSNATDFIQASSYRSKSGAVKIAEGKALTDGTEASNGMNGYSGTLTDEQRIAIGGKTLHRAVTTSYVDASGTLHENVIAIPLDNTMTTLAAGWYVVNENVDYTGQITLGGDVHLILADGCTMNVTSSDDNGIYVNDGGSMTIYGQTDGTGTLNATGDNGAGIYTDSGTITISGGTVTATGDNGAGIFTNNGDITISGGRVTATGGFGIFTNRGTITLGCTTASDFIYVSSYDVESGGRPNIAYGQTLFDEDGKSYSGNGVTIPDGKTLRPAVILADDASNATAISDAVTACTGSKTLPVQLSGRTLSKSGDWNTLCLPFDVEDGDTSDELSFSGTPLEGATVKELLTTSNLDSDGQLTLYFTAATSIKAGKPYIVKWEKPDGYDDADPETRNVKNPVFSGVTVTSNEPTAVNFTGGSFVGQYSPFSITADNIDEIILLSTGNRLGYSQNPRTLRSFRAHFEIPTNGGTPGARAFVLDFDGETTEIISPAEIKEITDCNATLSKREMAGAWYSLGGRKLDAKPTKKGLYIHNGNKVVIK